MKTRMLAVALTFASGLGLHGQSRTGFEETFDAPVDTNLWHPKTEKHADGIPTFGVRQEGGSLRMDIVQGTYLDGQFYPFAKRGKPFNLAAFPHVSVKIRIAPGALWGVKMTGAVPVGLSPWNGDPAAGGTRLHRPAIVTVPADGLWHECMFDWSTSDAPGGGIPNPFGSIAGFLFETSKWPDPISATIWLDDFRVGDKAVVGDVSKEDGF
jgi:hypothetical protein